jgi:hypothetical protein
MDSGDPEQRPDERIAWKTIEGHGNAGVVTFHRLDENASRVTVQMEYETEGMLEQLGFTLGGQSARESRSSSGSRSLSRVAGGWKQVPGAARSIAASESASTSHGAGRRFLNRIQDLPLPSLSVVSQLLGFPRAEPARDRRVTRDCP